MISNYVLNLLSAPNVCCSSEFEFEIEHIDNESIYWSNERFVQFGLVFGPSIRFLTIIMFLDCGIDEYSQYQSWCRWTVALSDSSTFWFVGWPAWEPQLWFWAKIKGFEEICTICCFSLFLYSKMLSVHVLFSFCFFFFAFLPCSCIHLHCKDSFLLLSMLFLFQLLGNCEFYSQKL